MKPILLIAALLLCGCGQGKTPIEQWPSAGVVVDKDTHIGFGPAYVYVVSVKMPSGDIKSVVVSREVCRACEIGGKFPPFEINVETK